jgi:hypothetical protein
MFPLELYRHGKLVIHGTCYVHALQYTNYPWIEYRVDLTRLTLPTGSWTIRDSLRTSAGGTGGPLSRDRSLPATTRITVHGRLRGFGGGLAHRHERMPARFACGVLVGHPVHFPVDIRPTEKVFATVAWPSFKLLGMNVPVDPYAVDGGLTP